MKRVKVFFLVAALLLTAGAACAQNYPTKPVRMIIPFAPGGVSDVVGRLILPALTKELGQPIVIDNRSGASGNVGVEIAARAPADGYTLLLGNIGAMAINPSFFPKFPIKPVQDFISITQVVDSPTALVIHPSLPVKSVKEFIEYAKANPSKLDFGTAGASSNGRLEMEIFMRAAGIKLVHVPYKGGAGASTIGLLSGEVKCAFTSLASVMTHVNAGKLKVLGVAAPQRVIALPDVPCFPELGYKNMKSGSWQGIFVPAGTAVPIVNKLFAVFTTVLADPAIGKRLQEIGPHAVLSKSPEEFALFLKEETDKWSGLIKEIGVETN
jgi:tripartite-type tricarboxylate transporter receptor subunit TctC